MTRYLSRHAYPNSDKSCYTVIYFHIDKFLVASITGQKTHGAPDHTKHPLHGHLHVLLNLVVGGCVKVDVEYLQCVGISDVA